MTTKSRDDSPVIQPAVKSGWLKKQGGVVKNWQRRWFVIRGDLLFYYKDEEETKSLGCIPLSGNKIEEHPFNRDDPGKYMFEIVAGDGSRMTTSHDTYPIWASSKEERQEWVTALRRVMYAHVGGGIFGQSLRDTMKYEIHHNRGQRVPQVVEECAEFIKKHGLETVGIFRLPGRESLMNELRNKYDCGERPKFTLETIDIHTAASMLKMYLRKLPEPIIPFSLYEDFLSIATSFRYGNVEKGLEKLDEILNSKKMPVHNYTLLHYMSQFLDIVSQSSEVNKMTMENLALIFGPNIIRSEEDSPESMMGTQNLTQHLTLALIRYHKSLFKMDYSSGNSIRTGDLLRLNSNRSNASNENGIEGSAPGVPSSVKELEDLDFSFSSEVSLEVKDDQNEVSLEVKDDQNEVSLEVKDDQNEATMSDASDQSEESTTSSEPQPLLLPASDSVMSIDSGLGDPNDNVMLRPKPVPWRPAPIPPPRRSQSLNSGARRANRSGLVEEVSPNDPGSDEEDKGDELPDNVPELQEMVRDLRWQMSQLKTQYKSRLSDMAKRLNQQQEATDKAVNRVVLLQQELLKSQM